MSDVDPSLEHVLEGFKVALLASPAKMSDLDPSAEHVFEAFKEEHCSRFGAVGCD